MEQERRVRCNHCMSIFGEEYIDVDALGPDSGETCPVCSKGDALMDMEPAPDLAAETDEQGELYDLYLRNMRRSG